MVYSLQEFILLTPSNDKRYDVYYRYAEAFMCRLEVFFHGLRGVYFYCILPVNKKRCLIHWILKVVWRMRVP